MRRLRAAPEAVGRGQAARYRDAVRIPGKGGREPEPVGADGLDAGHGWTVRADPPVTADFTPAYPPDGPDLGVFRCGYDAQVTHPGHGTLTLPPGTWILRETGERRG